MKKILYRILYCYYGSKFDKALKEQNEEQMDKYKEKVHHILYDGK